jgi:hypothetical protein
LKSVLFTLKSPHNIYARKFALKDEKGALAICGDAPMIQWVISLSVYILMICLFTITATHAPTVTLGLATVTRTTPGGTGDRFSRVRNTSGSRKSKSSKITD